MALPRNEKIEEREFDFDACLLRQIQQGAQILAKGFIVTDDLPCLVEHHAPIIQQAHAQ